MTKKDYILIAECIRKSYLIELDIERKGNDTKAAQASLGVLARNLSNKLALDNPRFDPEKFLKACGTEKEG